MAGVARLAPRRPFVAWTVVLVTATLHLFVGLSHFYPNVRRGWLYDARVGSHDGDVLTGAFLYDSYRKRPLRSAGVFHPLTWSAPIERTYLTAVRDLRDGRHKGERIVLVSSGGVGHVIHYFLQEARPTVVYKPRRYLETDAVTYGVGGASLSVIDINRIEVEGAPPIDVKAGDVVWLLTGSRNDNPDTEPRVVRRLPPGLALAQRTRMTDAPFLWTYRVEGMTP